MSKLGEEEADAFFHEGDAGTYDGGPALSIAPVGLADPLIEEDEEARLPSPEQLARREKFKRLVTTGMTTLAACSALVFALRGTKSESGAMSPQAPSITVEQPRAAARPVDIVAEPVAVKAAPVVEAPAIDVPPPPPVAPAVEAAPIADAPAPRAVVAPAVVAKRTASDSPRTTQHSSTVGEPAPASAPAVMSRPTVVMMTTSARVASSGHAPPTATFPD